ncbi:unnamed protein product [Meloidogyne enterolobii]|uniref:Uncharacterized protein n=1 Tax=Meloidogyne enterolobii TaxID=390850 RepID=A0ACB0XP27_MELEN
MSASPPPDDGTYDYIQSVIKKEKETTAENLRLRKKIVNAIVVLIGSDENLLCEVQKMKTKPSEEPKDVVKKKKAKSESPKKRDKNDSKEAI